MTSQSSLDEEPWEHEIQVLLGSLPAVRPPDGFIAQALDHRPLFAGRIGLGLSLAAAGTLAAFLAAGVFGPRQVAPELASMAEQHDVSSASVIGGLASSTPLVFEPVDPGAVASPVTLPPSWEPAAEFADADLTQVLYAEGNDAVSVFSEPGVVAWDTLPATGRTTIDGFPAWADAERQIVVVETADAVVTVVGLDPEDVVGLLADVPSGGGLWDSALDVADALSSSLGFPDS